MFRRVSEMRCCWNNRSEIVAPFGCCCITGMVQWVDEKWRWDEGHPETTTRLREASLRCGNCPWWSPLKIHPWCSRPICGTVPFVGQFHSLDRPFDGILRWDEMRWYVQIEERVISTVCYYTVGHPRLWATPSVIAPCPGPRPLRSHSWSFHWTWTCPPAPEAPLPLHTSERTL